MSALLLENEMYNLEDILPQRPPMILLSRVLEFDLKTKTAISEVDISSSSMFFDSATKGVPSYVGLEYIAQTIGCLFGIEDLISGKILQIEYMIGSKNFETFAQTFAEFCAYRILVEHQFSLENMSVFYGKILSDENYIYAEGDMKVYRSVNNNIFMDKK